MHYDGYIMTGRAGLMGTLILDRDDNDHQTYVMQERAIEACVVAGKGKVESCLEVHKRHVQVAPNKTPTDDGRRDSRMEATGNRGGRVGATQGGS